MEDDESRKKERRPVDKGRDVKGKYWIPEFAPIGGRRITTSFAEGDGYQVASADKKTQLCLVLDDQNH